MAHAQSAAPITVTPPTLVPERRNNGFAVDIPDAEALKAPAGAEDLMVSVGDVRLEGVFPSLALRTNAIAARLAHRTVIVREIYAAASEIESAHARAGYILARVSVPPQELGNGAPLRIVVTDGFIETVDVSHLSKRVRLAVEQSVRKLENRPHLRLRDIEQALVLANDVPGLILRSTLLRGNRPGGTRLVLEGSYEPVSGEVGISNGYDPSLGTWGLHAEVSLNSVLGFGEQFYGFVAAGYDVAHYFHPAAPVSVIGGGAVFRVGSGRLTVNPEATVSRTRPSPAPGAPQTIGHLRRLTGRFNYTLVKTRRRSSGVSLTLEQIDASNEAPDFGVTISHDRYVAARVGASWSALTVSGSAYSAAVQLSQGLGDLGAISGAEALATGVPFSRQGSSTTFSRLTAEASTRWRLPGAVEFALEAKVQTTFGKPVFRSEEFALSGSDALSAYVGDAATVDEGVRARLEVGSRLNLTGNPPIAVQPYAFAAAGIGRINRPSVFEPSSIRAANVGAGLRASLGRTRAVVASVEYAHGLSDFAPLDNVDRVNASLTLRF